MRVIECTAPEKLGLLNDLFVKIRQCCSKVNAKSEAGAKSCESRCVKTIPSFAVPQPDTPRYSLRRLILVERIRYAPVL